MITDRKKYIARFTIDVRYVDNISLFNGHGTSPLGGRRIVSIITDFSIDPHNIPVHQDTSIYYGACTGIV
jgi:hypothetical protein